MNNKFYTFNDINKGFEYTSPGNKTIEFDPRNAGVYVQVEVSCGAYCQGGTASVFVPGDRWEEFKAQINSIKIDEQRGGNPA
jgi:hypothetical protein